jgi:hypothetical protein
MLADELLVTNLYERIEVHFMLSVECFIFCIQNSSNLHAILETV